jgi:hypothetical protein
MRRTTRRLRTLSIFAALLVSVAGLPAGVAADTQVSHSGHYGAHGLIDSTEFPGATCYYDLLQNKLYKIRVRWPHVEGYSWTSSSRDYQKVSWRFKVYRDSSGGGTFALYATTPLIVAHTYDNQAAYWPSQTYHFATSAPPGFYRVEVWMYWYHPDSTVTGTAVHRPDYLNHLWTGLPFTDAQCSYSLAT